MQTHLGSPDTYTALNYGVSEGAYFNNSILANSANLLRDLALLDQVCVCVARTRARVRAPAACPSAARPGASCSDSQVKMA